MSSGDDFVKVYGSILDSSIWLEPDGTRLLWITMLAMADAEGVITASVGGLAVRARISRQACLAGLKTLAAPDPDSKNPENEGRRIEAVEGGWRILNQRAYRNRRSKRQVLAAERVRRWRERQAAARRDVAEVTPETQAPPPRSKARRAAFDPLSVPVPVKLNTPAFAEAWAGFCAYRKKRGKPFLTEDGPVGTFRHLIPLGPERAVEALRVTRESQWQGVEHGVAKLAELEAAARGPGAPPAPPRAGRKVAQEIELARRNTLTKAFAHPHLTDEQRESIVEAASNATCLEDLERILWPS